MLDVVVLGAGMAGLSAAAELARHGLDVLVLDARGRVGGRVHTLHDARTPAPIELGAELVHEGADVVVELAREARLALNELDGSTWMRKGGALVASDDFEEHAGGALGEAATRAKRGRDRSVDAALAEAGVGGADLRLARAFVQGFHAADPARMSARSLSRGGEEAGRSRRVHVGYAALAELLAARVAGSLRLGAIATRVAWRRGDVRVAVASPTGHIEEIRARAAVCALPLGVMQAREGERGAVAFEPAIDGTRRRLARLAMGDVAKVTLRFREAFWTDRRRVRARGDADLARAAFFFQPGSPFPTFWTARPLEAPLVVAWAGGPPVTRLIEQGDLAVVSAALDGFARALGVPASTVHLGLEAWFWHDWSGDPFARGAYSYPLVGGVDAGEESAAPLDGTLYFAGEHTRSMPENATVHGAILSGRRAATEVLLGRRARRA